MPRPTSRHRHVLPLLLLLAAPARSGSAAGDAAPDPGELAALDQIVRTVDDLELGFVYVERIAAVDERAARSHCYLRTYVFSGPGYTMRSETLDPVVTPLDQARTGCVMPGGQDLTVLHDGSVELYHEDLPETDEDHVIVSPLATRLGDQDPRQFGLCALLAHSIAAVEPIDGDMHAIVLDGGQRLEADLDLERMVCRRLAAFNCGGRLLGEYTFSEFVAVDAGDGSSFLYPVRTDLRRYDPESEDRMTRHVTWLLRSARRVAPVDVAAAIRDREIPGGSLVNDRRFVPEAVYRAGRRDGPAVRFSSLASAHLEHLATAADDAPAAPRPAGPSPERASRGASARGFEVTGLAVVLFGLLWMHRAARAERARRAGPAGGTAALLLVSAVVAAPAAARAEGPGLVATPAAVERSDTRMHDVIRELVLVRNDSAAPTTLEVTADAEHVTVWPRTLTIPAGGASELTVLLAVPAGRDRIEGWVRLEPAAAARTATLEIPLRITVSPAPARENGAATEPSPARPVAGPRPILATDAPLRDVGALLDSDERVVDFPFRNDGDAPLEIRSIEKDCGCVTAEVSSARVEPGEAARLTVHFAPEARSGDVRRHVYLTTNDPVTPVVTFLIEAEVTPALRFEPAVLELGRVSPGDEVSALLAVVTEGPAPAITAVTSDVLPILDHAVLDEGSGASSLAVLLAADAEGRIDGELRIEIEGRTHALRVPYRALVRGSVFSRPASLGLAYVDPRRPEDSAVEFALLADEPGDVVSVTHDESLLSVTPVAPRAGERERFRVHVAPGAPGGFFRTEVRVATTWRTLPVVVPVRGFVGE